MKVPHSPSTAHASPKATNQAVSFEVVPEWVHVQYPEPSKFIEVYGFAGSQGMVNVEGIRLLPKGKHSKTLVIYMHPAATQHLLPMTQAMARAGVHVLCAGSRYARNDTPLILENVALDLGAYVRHAKEVWGYEKIVLCGWSGGGSLAMFYQSQAEKPTVTSTPAGDTVDLRAAKLVPADATIFQAAHLSRARLFVESIDPSVLDENDPDRLDIELDIYNPKCPNQPPYSQAFVQRYRAAQLARVRRRTAWVKDTLERFRKRGGNELERGFVNYRTMADLRYMDPAIDPNGRKPRWCYLGNPETANTGPVGLARFSTLRAWLSQWSIDDTNVDGLRSVSTITVPLLAMENGADDVVPQPHTRMLYDAAGSRDKTMWVIENGTHYYNGQPELLAQAVEMCVGWMRDRKLFD